MSMESKFMKKLKPYVGVILLQFGSAGFAIVAKAALNQGTSHYTFAVYRNAIAALLFAPFALFLERKTRPKMTFTIFLKIMLLGLLDPVFGQNLFYAGMNYTTATVTSAMCNLIPALTFLLAWILRLEIVNFKRIPSHAKIWGTVVTVGGAMIMTLIKGPVLGLPWTHESNNANSSSSANNTQDPVKGALMIGAGCLGYSLFYILQAHTLKTYPAGLSLTALICTFGSLQGTVLTFMVERGNTSIWAVGWNAKLLAYVYGGIVSSGITYYVSGAIMKEKGPVFVTAFNPLSMVIVAVLSSFILAEQMDVGKVTGAIVIVIGLYLVIWGKSREQKEVMPITQQQHKSESSILATKTSEADNTKDSQISASEAGELNDSHSKIISGSEAV
ncbi:hypothetical protein BUALT_Bualt10G0048500 [Buddleja alternifolia]|uniref:WAT1-related protein n=1 Tax=Buddleja alternifolia TaxID=168488 RepID=A0AAV6X3D2_9LAMI|nr:hypothetical protein BUALT_Bualt10G0048400 [Buddleja alternifolia]KAG8374947.1 hypothetical protein BUALT_Bualt10G0048500 [Buddleja alternifolia]